LYLQSVISDLKFDALSVVDTYGVPTRLFTKSHIFKAIKNGKSMSTPLAELMYTDVKSDLKNYGLIINPTTQQAVTRLLRKISN